MDIQYLLWLQDFRNAINNALTPFMEFVSMFAVDYLILIPVFIYWCVDRKKGLYALVSYCFCMLITPLIKLTACVYRPWIRDARVIPAGDSIRTATGYSFPSGHTTTGSPLGLGTALAMKDKKQTRPISVVMIVFVCLNAFSRNYLGVHTPQDVCVGLLLSVLSLFVTVRLFAYLDEHPDKENIFLLCGFIVCWLGIIYITFKKYPMDLKEDGTLLVDPQKMMNDGYGDIGKVIGFIIARAVEKTWIRFKPGRLCAKNIIIGIAGLALMVVLKKAVNPVIVAWLGSHWGKLLFSVIYTCYYLALFPLVIKTANKAK
ncbi:MAG: phosphatase PAP2 family protein [Oscillospiraceae bacterium]|nr:phosphatase PAP2 family protein [Oscillospiraceae bacterium]